MTSTASFTAPGAVRSELEISTIRAISWRLIPFLVLAYFFSYLDRVNLSFAALTMNAELKFSPIVFAWGAGIFFIGYFLFEVSSNLALEKFGASRWIARIMVTWGIISGLMALVSGVWSFYGLRFLLGVAEAGFFPGMGRRGREKGRAQGAETPHRGGNEPVRAVPAWRLSARGGTGCCRVG
jgi:sugar phosphate permease